MSEKPEALRLADVLETHVEIPVDTAINWRNIPCVVSRTELSQTRDELRRQHDEIERLREALAWAYNLRHLRGHSDPVVIPERFAPFIEAAQRREDV